MAVRLDPRGSTLSASAPAKIVEAGCFTGTNTGNFSRSYDVSSDGRRFLMAKEGSSDEAFVFPQIVVVRTWFEELKRLAPPN